MSGAAAARERRIAEVVVTVARQALADRGARRIALLDDGSPEAALAARWLREGLGDDTLLVVGATEEQVESVLRSAGAGVGSGFRGAADERAAAEVARLFARLIPDALPAHPANKTALLLGGPPPPEPLLPLGDLYAAEVAALCGGWSAPPEVLRLADICGGVEALDEALRLRIDRRDPDGLRGLPTPARAGVEDALARGSAARVFGTVVPKLGARTLGVDIFE